MPAPLLALGALAVTNYLGTSWLNTKALQSPNCTPTIWGMNWDARPLLIGLGTVGALMFPPLLAMGSAGVGLAALANYDTTKKFKASCEQFAQQQARNGTGFPPMLVAPPAEGAPGGGGVLGAQPGWVTNMMHPADMAA